MTPENQAGNVANFCEAVANMLRHLIANGVQADQLAAGLRIEAATIEAAAPRAALPAAEAEMVEVQTRMHSYINTLQTAGWDERLIVSAINNVLIERVARQHGAKAASLWLQRLAEMVATRSSEIEQAASHC